MAAARPQLRFMKAHPRSGLTERDVARLHRELRKERQRLLEQLRAPAELARESEPRGDPADQAELSIEQDWLVERVEANRRHLRDVEDALVRLDQGSYGLDEESGEPLGLELLAREPWARHALAREEQPESEAPR
jgi:DnaK suppressor protein